MIDLSIFDFSKAVMLFNLCNSKIVELQGCRRAGTVRNGVPALGI